MIELKKSWLQFNESGNLSPIESDLLGSLGESIIYQLSSFSTPSAPPPTVTPFSSQDKRPSHPVISAHPSSTPPPNEALKTTRASTTTEKYAASTTVPSIIPSTTTVRHPISLPSPVHVADYHTVSQPVTAISESTPGTIATVAFADTTTAAMHLVSTSPSQSVTHIARPDLTVSIDKNENDNVNDTSDSLKTVKQNISSILGGAAPDLNNVTEAFSITTWNGDLYAVSNNTASPRSVSQTTEIPTVVKHTRTPTSPPLTNNEDFDGPSEEASGDLLLKTSGKLDVNIPVVTTESFSTLASESKLQNLKLVYFFNDQNFSTALFRLATNTARSPDTAFLASTFSNSQVIFSGAAAILVLLLMMIIISSFVLKKQIKQRRSLDLERGENVHTLCTTCSSPTFRSRSADAPDRSYEVARDLNRQWHSETFAPLPNTQRAQLQPHLFNSASFETIDLED